MREGEPKGERAERWSEQTRRLRKPGPEEQGTGEVSPALPAEEEQGRASRRMRGTEREEASETAAQHLAAARPPGTPRQPSPGGDEPARRFLPPLRCQMCTPLPPALHPHPSSPPGRAQHLLPVQSQFAGAPRTPRSPQRPGDTQPRHLWHPHPLMAFPAPVGRAGGAISACPQVGRVPLRGTVLPLPRSSAGVQQPRPQQSRAGGAGPPHPCQHFPLHPSCPESLWIPPSPGQGVPVARPRQIAG